MFGTVWLATVLRFDAVGRVAPADVTVQDPSLSRVHARFTLGADEVFNYGQVDVRETLEAMTGGKGVDVVYDPVGGDLAEPAFRSIAWRGRFLVVGFANGEIPKLPLNLMLAVPVQLVQGGMADALRKLADA